MLHSSIEVFCIDCACYLTRMNIKKEKLKNLFVSSDLGCVTAISLFYQIWSIDKSNPQKAEFQFRRESGLDELVQSYWSNTLQVSPLAYFQQLKIIKSRLYEQK